MEMPGFDAFFETGVERKTAPPKANDEAIAGVEEGTIPEEPPPTDDSGAFPQDSDKIKMRDALKDGSVTETTITAAARRVLYEMDRFGYLDGSQKHTITPQDIEQNAYVIRQTAGDAAVLLKNEHALPLGAIDLQSLALIRSRSRPSRCDRCFRRAVRRAD